MDVGGRGDRQIEGTPAGLTAALGDGCVESAALARDGCVKGKGVEMALDNAESADAVSAGLLIWSDEDAEMQLGQGDGADRNLLVRAALRSDQH